MLTTSNFTTADFIKLLTELFSTYRGIHITSSFFTRKLVRLKIKVENGPLCQSNANIITCEVNPMKFYYIFSYQQQINCDTSPYIFHSFHSRLLLVWATWTWLVKRNIPGILGKVYGENNIKRERDRRFVLFARWDILYSMTSISYKLSSVKTYVLSAQNKMIKNGQPINNWMISNM